jgi:hypothetical protein
MVDSTNVPEPDQFDELLSERTAKINERLEALEVKVDLWDVAPGHFKTLIGELREDQDALSQAAASVRQAAAEEWHEVAGRFMRALDRLEGEVATAWADFEAEVADDLDTFREASARQMESWHAHVDKMRLQAKLGEMEARDAVADLERAFDAARPELEKAKGVAADALGAAKESARELIAHLRSAARRASRKMD